MNKLAVHLDVEGISHKVGELYLSETMARHVFAYDVSFVGSGLEISPLRMPLSRETYIANPNEALYGLHGVFADSLPDVWGRKVQDAEFEKIGHYDVTALDRLAFVGGFGIGALRYEPSQAFTVGKEAVNLAQLRKATQGIIHGDIEEVSEELFRAGGSAGGARPKFLVDLNTETMEEIRYTRNVLDPGFVPVVLKVPTGGDDRWQRIEYAYSKMAAECDIRMPETYLLIGKEAELAHFASRRFDICSSGKVHVHSVAGIYGEAISAARHDYRELLRLTEELTRDHEEVVEMYRRMVFNILGHNKDDHLKNFSFLMNAKGQWSLSPAYDIGFSSGDMDMHAMSANGKRRNLTIGDFRVIAQDFEIKDWKDILKKTCDVLKEWPDIAKTTGLPQRTIQKVQDRHAENIRRVEKDLNSGVEL